MSVRSLPHFAHKPIGKTTHAKGFSYQHVNYITRPEACSKIIGDNMPDTREGARPYFDRAAYHDGVPLNARVADTLIIALPIDLTREQRHEVVARFMDRIGKGRIAWIAAFHDLGKDEHNPHCHLILRDADIETGRKVLGTTTSAKDVKEATEKGWKVPPRMTTRDLRIAWCEHLNAEMQRLGFDARFDQRTLKDRGIDREPEIHVGPKASSMAKKGRQFESQDRKRGDHANAYSLLDAGSRAEHNQRIRQNNAGRVAGRSPTPGGQEGLEKKQLRERQAAERKALYQEQRLDRAALRDAHHAEKLGHQRWARGLYATARSQAYADTKQQFEDRWKAVRAIKSAPERDAVAATLQREQKLAYVKSAEAQVAQARPVKDDDWQAMKLAQENARKELQQRHTEEIAALSRQHIAERQACHEKWQQQHLASRADRIGAKLETRQDMASVQGAALSMIKLHTAAGHIGHGTPDAAVGYFCERARTEAEQRTAIRYELNAMRQLNRRRATEAAGRSNAEPQYRDANGGQRQSRPDGSRSRSRHDEGRSQDAAPQSMTPSAHPGRRSGAAGPAHVVQHSGPLHDAQGDTARQRRSDRFQEFVRQQNADRGRDGGRSDR